MPAPTRLVTAGRVGKPHGLDGAFHVEQPEHPLPVGTVLSLAGTQYRVERRAGTDDRPLVRLEGVVTREAAMALRNDLLLVEDELEDGEWLADDLVGCQVDGLGTVRRVIAAPSCDLLELEGGELVPLIADAVGHVDIERRVIEIDRDFLRLGSEGNG